MRFETSLLAGALVAASPLQAAQPLDLSWQAPAGCPQEGAVREQIRALVPASMLESGNLQAAGNVTRLDKRFRLKLVLRFGSVRGERVIDSDSCDDLAGAAAVALGLLLQSAAQTGPTESSTAGRATADTGGASNATEAGSTPANSPMATPATPERPQPPEALEPTRSSESRSNGVQRERRWRAFVQAPALALGWGPLPDPTIGVAFALGFSLESWSFAAGLQLPREQRLTLPGASRAGADLNYWMAEARACRGFRAASLALAPCLTFGVEQLSASGTGAGVSPLSERATWASLGAAVQGLWYVGEWFAISLTAGARVEGARPTIRIDGLSDYRRLKPAALGLQAGPVWIF